MSDGRALLAAICAHPEEDKPRVAYADWLDENAGLLPAKKGEDARARAEFIRVQCELARMPPEEENADTATRRLELAEREAVLLKHPSRRRAWTRLPAGVKYPGGVVPRVPSPDHNTFVRGFPLFARGTAQQFLDQGETPFEIGPLHLVDCENIYGESADRFLALPWMHRVRRLALSTNRDERRGGVPGTDVATTEKLFATLALAGLEELELRQWEFGRPGSRVAGRAFAALRSLELNDGTTHGPATFTRLGELLPARARIRDLVLADMHYYTDELREVARLPQFERLERLTLGARHLDYASLRPRPPNVFGSYYPAPLRPEGVRAITSAPYWRHLRALRDAQGYGGFTEGDAEELAAAPPAPNLRSLHLVSGQFGIGARLGALAESPLLSTVTTLNLGPGQFGDAGTQQLAKSPHLNRLLNLQLNNCEIGPDGVKALAEAPWAANLIRLELSWNAIMKAGVDALTAPGAFPRLRRLVLHGAVKSSPHQDQLRTRFGTGVLF